MKGVQGAIHFDVTGDETDLENALARSRSSLIASGRTAEQEGAKIEQMFKRAASGVLAFLTVSEATNFVRTMATVHGEFQSIQIALSTILGSEERANILFAQLKDTAAKTPFDMKGVANGAKMLLAYGENVDTVNDTLIKLGNVAAGLSQPLGDIVYLYGTTMTQGRLYTQDLNQFTGRGIPMMRELAKEFGVAESEVRGLVEAGKVGFPEVQKVINNLTDEGGMFYNLMEKTSGSVTGKISNLEDAWSDALDKMGKANEGFLYSGIEGAMYLIEHYKSVLKVIGMLVSAYGSYKAALIVINTIQKVSLLAEQVKQYREMSKALGMATANQIAFNRATLVNPYVAAISALLTAISALYIFSGSTDKAAEAQAELNKNINDETKKLDDAYKAIIKAKNGTKERADAIESFNSDYGKYLSNLIAEKSSVEELSDAYAEAKRSVIEFQIAKAKDNFLAEPIGDLAKETQKFYKQLGDWTKELKNPEQQGRFTAYVDQILADVKGGGSFDLEKIYDAFRAAKAKKSYGSIEDWKTAFRAGDESFGMSNIDIIDSVGGWDVNQIDFLGKGIQRLQGVLNGAESDFTQFSAVYSDIVNPKTPEDGGNKFKTFAEQVEAAKTRVATLKSELKDLLAGKGDISNFSKAIEDKRKEISQAEDDYAYLSGIDPKKKSSTTTSSTDYKTKIANEARELKRLYEDLEFSIQSARVDAMDEGLGKVMAQRKLSHQQELAEIERQKEDTLLKIQEKERSVWESENPDWKKKGLTFTPTTTELPQNLADKFNEKQTATNDKFIADNKRTLEDALSNYMDFEHQRLAITKKTNDDIAELEKQRTPENSSQIDAAQAQARKQQKNALSEVNLSELKEDINWDAVFGKLDRVSYETLTKLRSRLKEYMQTAQATLSPTDLQTLADAYDDLNNKISELRPGDALKNAFADYKTASTELKKAREDLENFKGTDKEEEAQNRVTEALNKRRAAQIAVNESIKGFAGKASEALEAATAMTGALESFGIEIPESIKGALDGVGQIIDGLGSIDLTKPFSIVTGVFKMIGGLGKAIMSLFSGDNRKERQIQRLQSQVDALAKSYEKLNDAIDKSYSTDSADLIRQQDENLRRQKALIEEQIRLEEDKKDTDHGKVDQWRQAIDDIDKELAQTQDRIIEAIIGTDIKSAIDDFASAYVDAWAAGEDKAASVKDVVRRMVKSAVTELVKSRLSPEVSQFMAFLANAMQDGILSDAEQSALDEWEQRLYNKADGISDTFDKYLTEDKDREATSRGIATASQESVDENNGRLTVIQAHTYSLNENVKTLVILNDKMLDAMNAIRENTDNCKSLDKLDNIDKEITKIKNRLDDMGDSGIKIK